MVGLLDEQDIRFEVKTYNTSGDIDKTTPISEMEGGDFFTDSIEKALDRKSTRLNSSHLPLCRMPSSA